MWKFNREESWFKDTLRNRRSDEFQTTWRRDFHINGINLEKLVALVQLNLETQDTNLRKVIPVAKRVGVALWRLVTGNSFRSVSKMFAISKSTAVKLTHNFCDEIVQISSNFIKLPQSQIETATAMKLYKLYKSDCNCKIPQTVVAIDIFIQTSENESKFDYYCRKQKCSINTQAVVGSNLMPLNVSTGFPGSISDSIGLKNSSLFDEAEEGNILSNPTDVIENTKVIWGISS